MSIRLTFRGRATAAMLAFALLVAACGDDGSTGPSGGFQLAGTWTWQISNAVSGSSTCNVNNTTITFAGTNASPSGQFAGGGGGNVTCTINGIPGSSTNFGVSDNLKNLSFNGSNISFAFGTNNGDWPMSGTITGANSMGGTGTIRLTGDGQLFVLTGPWTATRN